MLFMCVILGFVECGQISDMKSVNSDRVVEGEGYFFLLTSCLRLLSSTVFLGK